MYRMLIVDDEVYIADSLYYFFKEQENLELDIYKCYNVEDAIKLLERIRFNIVITDIRMPGKSGIDLLSHIKQLWEDCRVIILSGYSQFEDAYQALKYNHVTYVLKTEGHAKLLSVVEKYIREIENESVREDVFLKLKNRLESITPVLQRDFVNRLLSRRIKEVTQHDLDIIGSGMSVNRPVVLLIARIDDLDDNMSSYGYEGVNQMLIIEIDRHISSKGISMIQTAHEQSITFIFQANDSANRGSKQNIHLYLKEILPLVQHACNLLDITVTFFLSKNIMTWEDIPVQYIKMKRMLNFSIGLNKGAIIEDISELQVPKRDGSPVCVGVEDAYRLSSYLWANKKESFIEEFRLLSAGLIQNNNMNDEAAHQCYMALALVVVDYINQYSEKLDLKYDLHTLLHPEKFESWAQGVDMLFSTFLNALELAEQSRAQNVNWVVKRVNEYIEANYMNDISLLGISDYIHFNPSYLSRLYKEITGLNIQDYIKKVRLTKAKELLEKDNLRISDIAAETGFNSSKYFISVFKKAYGLTPAEWREAHTGKTP